MAFIDKCTRMRRFAIIDNNNGNIEYEGVWIEGKYLYKEVARGGIYLTDYDPTTKGTRHYRSMILVWEDEDTDDMWVPRESCKKKWDSDGNFKYVYR